MLLRCLKIVYQNDNSFRERRRELFLNSRFFKQVDLGKRNTIMQKWKTLSSKTILNHPRLTIIEDEIILPNGKQSTYLKFKDLNAVTIICKGKDGKILLSKEYSYPPDDFMFQFPGGGINEGEDVQVAAKRELAEETDYIAKKLTLLGKYLINNRRSNSFMYVFLAEDISIEKTQGDEEEDIESYWFSEDKINQMIGDGEIINCHTLASWSIYNNRKK